MFKSAFTRSCVYKPDVVELRLLGFGLGTTQHLRLNVQGNDLALRSYSGSKWDRQAPRTTTHVQHPHAGLEAQAIDDGLDIPSLGQRVFKQPSQPRWTRE